MSSCHKKIIHLFLIVSLLIPIGVMAQTVKNEIGLYTDLSASAASTSIDIGVGVPFDVYLIVTNPYNEEFTQVGCGEPIQKPINVIPAFQFSLEWPEVGMYNLAEVPNGTIGLRIAEGPDRLIVTEDPIIVPESRKVLLMTYSFLVLDLEPKFLYLKTTTSQPYNGMLLVDAEEGRIGGCEGWSDLQDVFPSSGDESLPVFGINASVVATTSESWGGVKALYR